MTEPSSWPPPPDIPSSLAVHDEFLAACMRHSAPKPLLSRSLLVQKLHKKIGSDLRSCDAVVNDFCDRHLIFMPALEVWPRLHILLAELGCLVILILLGFQVLMAFKMGAALIHLLYRMHHLNVNLLLGILYGTLVVSGISVSIGNVYEKKKARAEAAEAVAKFTR